MRVPCIVGSAGAFALAAALSCGQAPPTSSPDIDQHICPVLFPPGSPVDTVNVALFDAVDFSHAPNWTNRSEQIVFAHLYETLSVKAATCDSEPLTQVVLSDSGRVATFTLRRGAVFSDKTPVTPRDVMVILEHAQLDGVDSLAVLDARRFEVHAASTRFDWTRLESPALAIVKQSNSGWPVGTGRYRLSVEDKGLVIVGPSSEKDPVVRFLNTRNIDPRDLIDGSFRPLIDIMVLDDIMAAEYARSQGLRRVELFPSKAFVLLAPVRAHAVGRGVEIPMIPVSVLESLARDAVHSVNAQALEETDPRWTRSRGCTTDEGIATIVPRPRSHRIAYDRSDQLSRDIVERIVALAGGDTSSMETKAIRLAIPHLIEGGKPPVAAGMDRFALLESLRQGVEFAYVMPVPLNRPEPCYVPAELARVAPWIAPSDIERKALPICIVGSFVVAGKVDRGYGYDLRLDPYGGFIVVGRDPGEPR